jgi:hypothetical protein
VHSLDVSETETRQVHDRSWVPTPRRPRDAGRAAPRVTGAPDAAPPVGPHGGSRNSGIALALVLLIGAVLVGLHVHSYRQLSQYDEAQHIDYVYSLLGGDVPASGDRWLPPTTEAVACRTIDAPFPYPACSPAVDNGQMPNFGLTTEFIQTPAYYLVPAVGLWVVDHVLPFDVNQISIMRSTNFLWLGAGIILLWLLLADLRIPYLTRAGLSLCLIASPALLLAQSTVTNDGTALAAGAAVTLVTLRWASGRLRMWVPIAVAVVALLLKATSLAVILMACAFVLVRSIQQSDRGQQVWRSAVTRRNAVFVGSSALATLVIAFGWSVFQESRATMDQMDILQNTAMEQADFDVSWLPGALLSVVSPLEPQWMQSAMLGVIGATAASMISGGLLALAVVGAVRSQPGSVIRALAISTGLAALAFGPLMVLSNYGSMHIWFAIPGRYGFTLLPAMAVLAAFALRGRSAQLVVAATGLTMCAAVAAHLIG